MDRWEPSRMSIIRRRDLLAGSALILLGESVARSAVITGHLPWSPEESHPQVVHDGPWQFFTAVEAAAVAALADRIIPPDAQTPGGKDAGCALFIDRQLAGPYGRGEGLYDRPPFESGSKQQGPQSAQSRAQLYRAGLAALQQYCQAQHGGKSWDALDSATQDQILRGLESSSITLPGVDAKTFFEAVLKDVQQGFFADPIYGGNRDMCAWKMIGFPGAHYDYREWVSRHNERYPYPPVSIAGRAEWTPQGS
jgi:gluconate 2-dehydrogenase gamma chain